MNYKRAPQKMVCLGMDLNRPPDLLAPGKYPFLKNVHSYQEGRLETRGPVQTVNAVPTFPDAEILSSFRLNDYIFNNFKRFLKIGTSLYYGDTTFSLLNSGYSNFAFTSVAYRPDQSARVWAYHGDFTKMQKTNTSGDAFQMGVTPPTLIPTAELGEPLYIEPNAFTTVVGWGNGGDAGAVALAARLTGVSIAAIKYDTGTTGWCSIAPTGGNFADITAGMRIQLNSAETATVEEVHKIYNTGTNTISQILYDAGTSGLCTIQPAQALTGIRRNAMILLGGTEYIRVISVTNADNGISSFRCSTTGTFAAGATITPPAFGSFRVFTQGTRAAGDTLTGNILQSTLTFSTGQGYINFNIGSPGYNLGNLANHPLGPDDYIHLGVMIDHPENLIEGKLLLDVDTNTTNVFNAADGNQNAYYVAFRGNDLQNTINQGTTSDAARTQAIQTLALGQQDPVFDTNQNPQAAVSTGQAALPSDVAGNAATPPLANPIATTSQMALGNSQYSEFKWKLADLVRIGSAQAINISDVRAIQVRFTVSATCVISISDLWVGGGYGPDTGLNLTPFIYRFRYRASGTGAHSLPGPAMRSGIVSQRQQINLTGVASTDPQVDKIDWERLGGQTFGGDLTWHYIGTSDNSTPTFVDEQLSAAILVNPPLAVDSFQPFPISDVPQNMVVTVAGTAMKKTGGTFPVNPNWARGMEIIVGGKYTTLYASPVGDVMHLADSIPAGTNIYVEFPEPIVAGKPLPFIWGPFDERIFGVGNILDVGSVYFTERADPDSAPDTNRIEVCSPSEVLVHGCVFDGRSYVFSDKRIYALIPSFRQYTNQIQGGEQYNVVPVPNSKGLWAPYTLTTGPKIWFMSSDGIYEFDGGSLTKISVDINPLFPDGDRAGYAVNGLYPIKMQNAGPDSQINYLRLAYHNNELFFDYRDCHDDPQTLVYNLKDKAWYYYVYFEGDSPAKKVIFHVSETDFIDEDAETQLILGTNAGLLFESIGNGSGVETINCKIRTPALDVGDSRAKKIYGDIVYDMDTGGVNVLTTPYINNYQVALPSKTYNEVVRTITAPADLVLGAGQFARNLGVEISWSLTI